MCTQDMQVSVRERKVGMGSGILCLCVWTEYHQNLCSGFSEVLLVETCNLKGR